MSKPLTFAATLSVLAMAALALGSAFWGLDQEPSAGDGAATAHGSLVEVLVQA